MYLSCNGINHHSSALSDRESFQIQKEELARSTADFKRISGSNEAAIVTTCNRIEFYCADSTKVDVRDGIRNFYIERGSGDIEKLDRLSFIRQGTSVARHLFKVAAGLDSALLGEYQILGQVKEAYSAACSVSGPGRFLHKLFHNAFQVSKRIRTETEIGKGAQGLAGATVDILQDALDLELNGLNATVIGVNKSTEMLLRRLHREKIHITLLNRTLYNAEKLARPYGAAALPLDELSNILLDTDLLFSAASAEKYIVEKKHFNDGLKKEQMIAVDLAIPRNIDPKLTDYPGVTVLDLDDIKHYLSNVNSARAIELPYALDLIEEQVAMYEQWRRNAASNGNGAIRKLLEEDRHTILNRFQDNFNQGELKALDAFSRSLYRQFLRRVASESVHTESRRD